MALIASYIHCGAVYVRKNSNIQTTMHGKIRCMVKYMKRDMRFLLDFVSLTISLYDGKSHVLATASSYVGKLDTSALSCISF